MFKHLQSFCIFYVRKKTWPYFRSRKWLCFNPILYSFIIYVLNVWLFCKLNGCSVSWNNSHIYFGTISCFALHISIGSFWIFLWWILKVFFFSINSVIDKFVPYSTNARFFLAIYWLIYWNCGTISLKN